MELQREVEAAKRDKKKTVQDSSTKDVKLNRVIEELERYKIQLKEAKANESQKNESMQLCALIL